MQTKQYWFNTLNEALASEDLIEYWPMGSNIEYGQNLAITSNGKRISVYRDEKGLYERPVHYTTQMV